MEKTPAALKYDIIKIVDDKIHDVLQKQQNGFVKEMEQILDMMKEIAESNVDQDSDLEKMETRVLALENKILALENKKARLVFDE